MQFVGVASVEFVFDVREFANGGRVPVEPSLRGLLARERGERLLMLVYLSLPSLDGALLTLERKLVLGPIGLGRELIDAVVRVRELLTRFCQSSAPDATASV